MKLLEVSYDDDGVRHYWRDGEEVSEIEWMRQHPQMNIGDANHGRNSQNSGQLGSLTGNQGGNGGPDAKEQVRQGIRLQREAAKAQREGSSGDELGQRGEAAE